MVTESYSLRGDFPPHWLGNLTAHLAGRQIDVDNLQAEIVGGTEWCVEMRLRSLFPVGGLNLEAMACERYESSEPERGTLSQYWLRRSDGSLHLALRAEDRLGFLARLCSDLAALALFPVRVDARSGSGWLTDTFWLLGIGRSVPHDETEAALVRFLDGWRSGNLSRSPSGRPGSIRPPSSRSPTIPPPGARSGSSWPPSLSGTIATSRPPQASEPPPSRPPLSRRPSARSPASEGGKTEVSFPDERVSKKGTI